MISEQTQSTVKLIQWAKKAKAIWVPVQGSGGASVKVNRKDFIDLMSSLQSFDGHGTFSNGNLYMGG